MSLFDPDGKRCRGVALTFLRSYDGIKGSRGHSAKFD